MSVNLYHYALCYIITFSYFAHCSGQHNKLDKDTVVVGSTLYNNKRLILKTKANGEGEAKNIENSKSYQFRGNILETGTEVDKQRPKQPNRLHNLNKKLLNKLGFTKVKAPNNNNRKRLAIESRRHASPDDSHMFIVKLPPNFYYYSNPTRKGASAVGLFTTPKSSEISQLHSRNSVKQQATEANGKKVSFPFNSNGKPGRIYHWNLPILKEIINRERFPHITVAIKDQLIGIKNTPTWTKPWENETVEKYGKANKIHYKKSTKRKTPSYYAPVNAVNKNSFNKYFAGNGKPDRFYIMKKNETTNVYENILP